MIKTIYFDLGNVLVDVNKEVALKIFAAELNASRQSLLNFPDSEIEKKYETGEIDTERYLQGLKDYFKLDEELSYQYLKKIWRQPFTIIADSVEILDKVREQTNVVLLSNTNPLHIDAVDSKYPDLLDRFDDKIFSFTAGASKPDPKIYDFALNKVGVNPAQALFIDDLEENIAAAEEKGIDSHLFRKHDQLINFLARNGIKVEL